MTKPSQETTSRRWPLPFLAALLAVLVTILSSATASAATTAGAGTRVRGSVTLVEAVGGGGRVFVGTPRGTANGTTYTVTRYDPTNPRTTTTYNLSVQDIHTYHIGTATALVHNGGPACDLANGAAKAPIDVRPPLSISSKQFGSKRGKHASDYGLNPASSSSRSWSMNRAREVHLGPDEVRRGPWNPSGGGGNNYFFFRQGDDLVITRPGGEFVAMFPNNGNAWFTNAEVFPH